jgi:hypothetical protein
MRSEIALSADNTPFDLAAPMICSRFASHFRFPNSLGWQESPSQG